MEKTKWTDKQKEAIDSRGKNIIVSAAAGSGKTAVLTQRILELIVSEKIDVTSMLILTFTNAAANEMKTRIQKKMYEYLEEHKDDRHIREQISLVPNAPISTMHSFCIESIRQNFNILGIDPSFSIGNEATISMIKYDAIQEIFDKIFKEYDLEKKSIFSKNVKNLFDIYASKNDDKKLIYIIYQIHSFIQGKVNPNKWLDEQIKKYEIQNINKSPYMVNIIDDIKSIINHYFLEYEKLEKMSAGTFYEEIVLDDFAMIKSLKEKLDIEEKKDEKNFEEIFAEIKAISFKKAPVLSAKKKKELQDESEEKLNLTLEIKDLRSNTKDALKKFIEKYKFSLDEYAYYMNKTKPIVESLCTLVKEFSKRYEEKKIEKNIFDFNDLEHFMLKLLEDDIVKKTLQNKYSYIFYDEYQDSNEVHDTIIRKIAKGNNLFFVGDVKQSIYGFRLADPSLFIDKYDRYSKVENETSEKIDLSSNFRSSRQIIDFCNKIFEEIMTRQTCKIEYNEDAKLLTDDDTPNKKELIQINMLYDDNAKKSENEFVSTDEESEEEILEKNEMLAEATAKQIENIMKNDSNIQYKDIVILQRSLVQSVKAYETIFRKYNIPVFVDYKSAVFQILEVSLFIDLLRLIDNLRQDEPLLSVMLSNVGGFSIEDIAKIKSADTSQKYFYKNVLEYASYDDVDENLASKITEFLQKIEYYANMERYMPLDEFIDYVMEHSKYKDYVMSMKNGNMRLDNLGIISEKSKEFMQSENKSLFNFLLYIDNILKNKNDNIEPKKISDSQNVVRVMSIHKSKGLEFNTVILNVNNTKFSSNDLKNEIYLDSTLGIGVDYTDTEKGYAVKTLAKYSIGREIVKKEVAEEIRIFYVALTRAKQRLIINLKDDRFVKNKNSILENTFCINHKNMKSYGDFLLLGIKKDIEDNIKTDLYEINEINVREYLKEKIDDDAKEYFDKLVSSIELTKEEKENLDKNYVYEYKYVDDMEKEIKLSVTSIAKEKEKYKIPKLVQYNEKKEETEFSPTKIGTLNHLFLEHIDFSKTYTKEELSQKVKDMVELEFITQEESRVINIDNVHEFLKSELGNRIRNAKKIYQEESFIMDYFGSVLTGIVDLFFEEGDEIVLVDYKTDNIKEESIYTRVDYYRKQIELYKEAITKAFDKKVKDSYIYFLSLGKCVEVK